MKKLGILVLALVLALGVMGVGLARWAETLTIDGSVETGNIGAEWSIENCSDDEAEGKDVSSVSAVIDGDTLRVTVTNAYPCITYTVHFDIHGTGSVPCHLGAFVIDRGTLPSNATLTITDLTSSQLHNSDRVYGFLTLHLDNDAEENTTYTFGATLEYAQYNEP